MYVCSDHKLWPRIRQQTNSGIHITSDAILDVKVANPFSYDCKSYKATLIASDTIPCNDASKTITLPPRVLVKIDHAHRAVACPSSPSSPQHAKLLPLCPNSLYSAAFLRLPYSHTLSVITFLTHGTRALAIDGTTLSVSPALPSH